MRYLKSSDLTHARSPLWRTSLCALFVLALAIPASRAQQSPTFTVQSYQGTKKCLDYGGPWPGSGATVFLNDCTASHPIAVEEINSWHEVILHAGAQVIGFKIPVVSSTGAPAPGPPYQLVLQSPNDRNVAGVQQVFALDGDSIILASTRHAGQPDLVAQVLNARGTNGTPILVGARYLADSEFWSFNATNGADIDPTSGFVRVSTRDDLLIAMYKIIQGAQVNSSDLRCYGTYGTPPKTNPALGCKVAWGNVIKIMGDGDIDLSANPAYIDVNGDATYGSYFNLVLPTGVTLRGDRHGVKLGPQLYGNYMNDSKSEPDQAPHMIEIEGDYVRITGLRVQGPTDSTTPKSTQTAIDGINIGNSHNKNQGPGGLTEFTGGIVDHNEVYSWTVSAIGASGGVAQTLGPLSPPQPAPPPPAPHAPPVPPPKCPATDLSLENRLLLARNFVHHNEQHGLGYGIVVGDGASATILGNTFLMNRHAIASDGTVNSQYKAVANLVLTDVPRDSGPERHKQQDFDMHGTLYTEGNFWGALGRCLEGLTDSCSQQHDGGYAGNKVDISWNTFLGDNRDNFDLRGKPCDTTDTFSLNVSMQSSGSAIQVWDYNGKSSHVSSSDSEISISDNRFGVPNPAGQLTVGDFDGDGTQDIFLATGAAWFYSPAGKAGWVYLNGGKTDNIKDLLFGDFDGDGRTDVLGINGSNLMVSWGGISDWEVLNSLPKGASVVDLAVGDFNGDGRSDIFYSDGKNWYVSSGGSGAFNSVATSSFRVPDLRFGHFSVCGTKAETDVFGIVSGKWMVSCGASAEWKPLPVSLTSSLTGLVVADFDGDNNVDIGISSESSTTATPGNQSVPIWSWKFFRDAANGWGTPLAAPVPLTASAAIGFFDSNRGADVLLWGDWSSPDTLSIASGGNPTTLQRWSIEEMR